VHIILVLVATSGPNLTFLGLLSAAISFGEQQSPTQTDTQLISPFMNLSVGTFDSFLSMSNYGPTVDFIRLH